MVDRVENDPKRLITASNSNTVFVEREIGIMPAMRILTESLGLAVAHAANNDVVTPLNPRQTPWGRNITNTALVRMLLPNMNGHS
jgi:hypothetical protein